MKIKNFILFALAISAIPGAALCQSSQTPVEVVSSASSAKSFSEKTASSAQSMPIPTIRYVQWIGNDQVAKEPIYIIQGSSQVLRFNRTIARVSISNPDVCDVTPLGTQEILLHAKGTGSINLMLWDENYNLSSYNIQAIMDVDKLKQVLQHIDPSAEFTITPFNGTAAVYGETETAQKLGQINSAATAFNPTILSFVKVANPKQILLEVRFAEITRTGNKDWGFDFDTIWGSEQSKAYAFRGLFGDLGLSSGESTGSVAEGFPATGDMFDRANPGGSVDLQLQQLGQNENFSYALQWLVGKGIAKIIARPNLLAREGEQAEFLVGGEFPIPVATSDRITVDYREFGTQLKFKPNVLEKEIIRLEIETDVSELDFSNTVSVGASVVPSMIRRSQKTVAELKDNQTLVIGGMLTQRVSYVERKLPVLGDTPIVEGLFKRMDTDRTDVELIVVITPHIVSPFEMSDRKKFYSPEDVKKIEEGTRIFTPPFEDLQADSIRGITAQNESFQELGYGPKTKEIFDKITGKIAGKESTEPGKFINMSDLPEEKKVEAPSLPKAETVSAPSPSTSSSSPIESSPAKQADWQVIPGTAAATASSATEAEEAQGAALSDAAAQAIPGAKMKQKKITTSEEIIYYS